MTKNFVSSLSQDQNSQIKTGGIRDWLTLGPHVYVKSLIIGLLWSPKKRFDPVLSSLAILKRTERVDIMARNNRYVENIVIGYKETIGLRDWLQ